MLTRLRTHLTQNVIAYIALFIAMGGTSYGLASGSVDSREIKNDTVRTRDIRNNEVRSRDIRNRTILGRDILSNALDADQIDESGLGKVPSATSADLATNALSLGGTGADGFARVVATTVDIDDGDNASLLTLPNLGQLSVPPGGCDASGPTLDVAYVNGTGSSQDFFSSEGGDHTELSGGGSTGRDNLSGTATLRIGQRSDPDRMATVELFVTDVAGGAECRVSAQALLSG
jgi:hypothetical protein